MYLVIGGEGDLKDKLEALCLNFDLGTHVRFVGNIQRSEAPSYYNMCDIFIMPSISDKEGNIDDQPVSLIEAMACGKPIVATNFPGISMTVKDGVNGLLVPQKDVSSIGKVLELLLSSGQLRIKMGKESRKITVNRLSVDKISNRYIKIFKDILK